MNARRARQPHWSDNYIYAFIYCNITLCPMNTANPVMQLKIKKQQLSCGSFEGMGTFPIYVEIATAFVFFCFLTLFLRMIETEEQSPICKT